MAGAVLIIIALVLAPVVICMSFAGLAALLGQSRNQRRVRMAQSANGDAGAKIEIARPVFGHQPCALASHERNVSASVSGKERRLRQVGRL